MPAVLRRSPDRPRRRALARATFVAGAVALATALAGCGAPPEPQEVEGCLREGGLSVANQPGVSAPVEAKVNFTTSGTPDPASSSSVIFYSSEDEATRNLAAAKRAGETFIQEGAVIYSPTGAGGTTEDSEALVEGCVVSGEAGTTAEEDDDADKKKKKKKKR